MEKESDKDSIGRIVSIDGPIIGIKELKSQKIGDLIRIGNNNLTGEIIKISKSKTTAQCYDFTDGLGLEERIINTNSPIYMELAPGLLGNIYDGIQRPLEYLYENTGAFIDNIQELIPISREKKWLFKPSKKVGDLVKPGDILGSVRENSHFTHNIMVPPYISGKLIQIVDEGDFTIDEKIYTITKDNIDHQGTMIQKWPIRTPRPYESRNYPEIPLITGIRIIDLLLPFAKGGSIAIPGGFGTGKTVTMQSIAKWSDADIIIYVHCGERGLELADILEEFPNIINPHTKKQLMERTIIIGHTSNMPVSARETSIFAGLTIAEYFRDMGNHVALLTDSLSRWVESLRELSGRLEEMPAAGGYPAYMSTRLANFYERAGYTTCLGSPDRNGSITIVGNISPPAGDFSEPVTKTSKRFARAILTLDSNLAYSRFYPSISLNDSYSLYGDFMGKWWDKIEKGWASSRQKVMALFTESEQLKNAILLLGSDNLPREQQLEIFTTELIKQSFLEQDAFDENDKYCSPLKTLKMIKVLIDFYDRGVDLLKAESIPIFKIKEMKIIPELKKMRFYSEKDFESKIQQVKLKLIDEMNSMYQEDQYNFLNRTIRGDYDGCNL